MSSLEDWNKQFGGMDLFAEREGKGGSTRFEFEYEVAYPCRIKRAQIVRSQRGDLQLELSCEVQANDGDDSDIPSVGKTKLWLDLPKQASDLDKPRDVVVKMTQRRYENLMRVLSAAQPHDYALYNERKERGGKAEFYDFDGQQMDGDDFNDRKVDIQTRCTEFVDQLIESEGEPVEVLEDALLYVQKVRNPKNEKYPYTNYYAQRPRTAKVFSAQADAVPF